MKFESKYAIGDIVKLSKKSVFKKDVEYGQIEEIHVLSDDINHAHENLNVKVSFMYTVYALNSDSISGCVGEDHIEYKMKKVES